MKFKLSICNFLMASVNVSELAIAPVTMARVAWIKQLREDCGVSRLSLKEAKDIADLLYKNACETFYAQTSFIFDTNDHHELLVLLEQDNIMCGNSKIVKPIGFKKKTAEDILRQAANQLIECNSFKEAIDVLYILQAKEEE